MTLIAKDDRNSLLKPEGDERRRCKRLPITFSIEVSGIDSTGEKFSDRTVTSDVSAGGCRFDLLRSLHLGAEITIRLASRDTDKRSTSIPLRFMVVWVQTSESGWSIGAEKMQPENIWHIAFPKRKVLEPAPR